VFVAEQGRMDEAKSHVSFAIGRDRARVVVVLGRGQNRGLETQAAPFLDVGQKERVGNGRAEE
jgi:hypothetical protein